MESIVNYFESIDPVLAALYATLFTWGLTALGASLVFFFKQMNRKLHISMKLHLILYHFSKFLQV